MDREKNNRNSEYMRDAVAFVAVVTCVYFQLALEKPVHCIHAGGLGHECGGKFAYDLGLHFVTNNLAHVVSRNFIEHK